MFPFWNTVIAPILEAAGTRTLVEIGALRGENTRQIIEHLGPECVLHVIDPAPDFDPTEHQERFGGQYVFHRQLSLDVLGDLPPMDAALIDGDHNWYTVYHELKLLKQVARDNNAPLPVLILHDVGWPYGRRDLYYAPDDIPAEHRRAHRRAGMRPGRSDLLDSGGMSAGHWNAEREGGPHNGVMTALEDFLAEHDQPHELLVIPIYFGLAIVIETERLQRQPALAAELERLRAAIRSEGLLELAEDLRLRSMVNAHTIRDRSDRRIAQLADRYLDNVARGLLDEFHLENEVRLDHLLDCVSRGQPANEALLRDPVRSGAAAFESLRSRRRTGALRPGAHEVLDLALVPAGRVGIDDLQHHLDRIRTEEVGGDLVVCGAGRGGVGVYLRAYQEAHELTDRRLWVADRFHAETPGDLNTVRDLFDRFDLLDDRVVFLQGELAATLPTAETDRLALLYLGSSSAHEVHTALTTMYDRLVVGGVVVVEDRTEPTVAEVIDTFRAEHAITSTERRVGIDGSAWTVDHRSRFHPGAGVARSTQSPERTGSSVAHAPIPSPVAAGQAVDLTVIVVFYNMRREAARTLHSLSRAYQVGIDDLSYEVIVVENGSDPDQRLGHEMVARFGDEFRYLDMGDDASPSPVGALNRGIAESRGRALALMIDGAHVLTPGVLRYATIGLAAHAPAIVATQAWYVGPGQQGEAMRAGYDQEQEDALFERISWPDQGYRIFEIGHIQGDRDWLEGVWESNCLFVSRALLEQVGGFDEGFDMPGGGYANLDLYERLGSSPDVEVVTILGEATFHQVHGGTTTNLVDPAERRTTVRSYFDHHRELRGRPFIGPEKPLRFVGAFETNESKRTRSRRITASAFEVDPALEGDDGPLGRAQPVPDDLRDSFTRAYWRSRVWQSTRWMGRQVHNAATDLVTYQEVLADVRPDWIVDTGTRHGGRAWFLATVCDLLGHGRVVSVGPSTGDALPEHSRISYVTGAPQRPEVAAEVRAAIDPGSTVLVVLGTRGRRNRMRDEFDAYADLVTVGSYVIIEHTMLNGWPVDGSFGKGPFETVRAILASRSDFVVDHEREKQSLTFNPYGFLRRIN